MPHTHPRTRQQLAAFLPAAITKALSGYRELTHMNIERTSSEYKKHQEACKVAVAHINLLIKLAKDVAALSHEGQATQDNCDDAALQAIIENAQKELKDIE